MSPLYNLAMPDVLKLSITFLLIVLLLRKKVNIGLVMFAGAGALAALYLTPPAVILRTAVDTVTERVTLELILALALIRMLELVLREREILKEMMAAFKALFGNRKAVIVSMPLLIGMLPSVGGAYFSAPMVRESTEGLQMPPEEKGFINYWFRHPWEFILPLYPGLLLASAITGTELRTLMLANLPYAALMAAGGFLFSMRRVKSGREAQRLSKTGLLSFLPIGSVLLLVIAFGVRLYLALLVVVASLLVFYRYRWGAVGKALRHGFSLDVAVLITGVIFFKGVMEASGAVEGLSLYFASRGIPLMPMLLVLPFVAGMLTGLTIGFVGATFPLLVSLSDGSIAAVTLAFAAGFAGVLLSPVHVCLILTREYFAADMGGIYRRMLPPLGIVLAAAVTEYFLLSYTL